MADTIQQFDFSVNLLKALLWQYNEAKNLQGILEGEQAWFNTNQSEFWQNWIRDVFDLRTANEFGLQVWAIILGQPLFLNKGPDNKPTWGFGQYYVNFERGNFSSQTGSSFKLSTASARVLLRLRYYQLIGTCTPPSINRMLADVFSSYGAAFVLDNQDMTQTYTFTFALPSDLVFLFNNFDVLPRPAGVGSDYNVIINESWGFDQYHENFDHGNFSEL
jgi:hypothetical protein